MKLNPNCSACQARLRGIHKAAKAGRTGRPPSITAADASKYVRLRQTMTAAKAAAAIGATPEGARKAAKRYGFTA